MKRVTYSAGLLPVLLLIFVCSLAGQNCTFSSSEFFTIELLPLPEGCCGAYVSAQELLTPPEDGCDTPTAYALYREAEVLAVGPEFVPEPGQDSLFFSELDDETTVVYVFAFDEEGNYEVDQTFVLVQQHVACDCAPEVCTQPACITSLLISLEYDPLSGQCDFLLDVADIVGEQVVQECAVWVSYAIYRESTVGSEGFTPLATDNTLLLSYEDLGTLQVRVYAIAQDGSFAYCTSYLLISDCLKVHPFLTGVIATEPPLEQAVAGVEVVLSGEFLETQVTQIDGTYYFGPFFDGGDYSLTPHKNSFPANGVTTLDLIRIIRHLLVVTPLASPYQMIAADANGSGSISTLDLIAIRKVILGISVEFPNSNTSWRFVPASYTFPDPANPWAEEFPEALVFNNLTIEDATAFHDFVAIKVGDVNGTANPAL